MADGKWISDLTAQTPLVDAARHVLMVRLEVVRDHLPPALHGLDRDPEPVHQLRVATRRAGAALEIFQDSLPDKAYRAARKHLRGIRRAAGAARDWDVFLLMLSEWGPAKDQHRPGLDFLTGYAFAHRLEAQTRLEMLGPHPLVAFDRFLMETVAAVHKPRSSPDLHTLVDLARPLLSRLLGELTQAVAADLEDYENLHQVRIIGKRLRYAMEVFADCFVASFRERLYPAVEGMQEILGRANDSFVASQRLVTLRDLLRKVQPEEWKRCRAGLTAVLQFHQRRLPRERRCFLDWWKTWHQASPEESLVALLKESPPRPIASLA
jgi:CHAD domain-containing protein